MKRCVRTKHLSGVDHSSKPLKRLYEIVFKNADRVDKKLILLRTREQNKQSIISKWQIVLIKYFIYMNIHTEWIVNRILWFFFIYISKNRVMLTICKKNRIWHRNMRKTVTEENETEIACQERDRERRKLLANSVRVKWGNMLLGRRLNPKLAELLKGRLSQANERRQLRRTPRSPNKDRRGIAIRLRSGCNGYLLKLNKTKSTKVRIPRQRFGNISVPAAAPWKEDGEHAL